MTFSFPFSFFFVTHSTLIMHINYGD
jgi:hypothetical protein